tara:strand:+ start:485 stop:802 length:318 start_codon:yes stop_codon:yes gene_type:complete
MYKRKLISEKLDPIDTRKIIFEAVDPTGVTIDIIELDYYEHGYRKETAPEGYPKGEEPRKQVRYILTIGDYKYLVNRNGRIIEELKNGDLKIVVNSETPSDDLPF